MSNQINSSRNPESIINDTFEHKGTAKLAKVFAEMMSRNEKFSNFDECVQSILDYACLLKDKDGCKVLVARTELRANLEAAEKIGRYSMNVN